MGAGLSGSEIVFTVNSPGEVSTWLAPAVRAVKSLAPAVRVSVMILPCLYASGTEIDVVRRMTGVDAVVGPGESLRFILYGRLPAAWQPSGRGAVVFLGGELWLAARLAKRLGYPAAAYTEWRISGAGAFRRIFVPRAAVRDSVVRQGATPERVRIVGDLMVDAARVPQDPGGRARVAEPLGFDPARPVVAVFPGSRPHELRVTLPLFLAAALKLAQARPELQLAVSVSPYTTRETFGQALNEVEREAGARLRTDCGALLDELFSRGKASAVQAPVAKPPRGREPRESASSTQEPAPVHATLETPDGAARLCFWRGESRAVMAAATLALTIPGSNTAELAAWGVPMVVCLPLKRPEEIPLDGLAGYIDKIPLVGRKLKAKAVLKAAERAKFVALPNRIAQELIALELRSTDLSPDEVAREAQNLLADPRRLETMGKRLVEAMGPGGAAEAITRHTLELLPGEEQLPAGSS